MTTTTRTRTATPALVLTSMLGLLAASATVRANPIDAGFSLSDAEASRAILLDGTGARINVLRGPRGATRTMPANASPAYVAYRLDRASELPAGYPSINIGAATPRGGPPRGPLRLDVMARTALDAELARSGGSAAVYLPRQTYLVQSIAALVGSSSPGATQVWLASNAGGGSIAAPAVSHKSLGDTLKDWFDTSTDAIAGLNKQIADAVKSRFSLKGPEPVILPAPKGKGKVRTAAQILTPPAEGTVQPAPVPEPASLLVFTVATAAALARLRKGGKSSA